MYDLHMHTYYSDGRASPQELIEHVSSLGMKTIAITDHDNIRGNLAARPFAEAAGIELIPAIEMTTHWEPFGAVDILGYFIDYDNTAFQQMIAAAMGDMRERVLEALDVLDKMGYTLTYDDLLAQNPRYCGGLAIITSLEQRGYTTDFQEGLALFKQVWKQVRPGALTSTDAITTVNAADGVTVLAHPTRIRREWLTLDEIRPLADAGLSGIEVYHPSVGDDARPHFMQIATALGLQISGGSDEHGYPEGFPRMGIQPVTAAMVEGLRACAGG